MHRSHRKMNAAIEKHCAAPHTLVTELSSISSLGKKQFEREFYFCSLIYELNNRKV